MRKEFNMGECRMSGTAKLTSNAAYKAAYGSKYQKLSIWKRLSVFLRVILHRV